MERIEYANLDETLIIEARINFHVILKRKDQIVIDQEYDDFAVKNGEWTVCPEGRYPQFKTRLYKDDQNRSLIDVIFLNTPDDKTPVRVEKLIMR